MSRSPAGPSPVIEAADAADIARTLRFAAAESLPVAVQCTGHGAVDDLDGALLVLTRGLSECVVHPEARWARVGAGLTWQPVLDAAGAHGLAALAGSSPGVGVVGYTTGGGVGPLARTLGLASTGCGHSTWSRATASCAARPGRAPGPLLGLRGGKGALGVVTAVEFDLLPIRGDLRRGAVLRRESCGDLLGRWADWSATLPPEATTSIALMQLPSMPGVPEPLADRLTVAVRFAWTGDPDAGRDVLAAMRAVAPPLIDGVGQILSGARVDPCRSRRSHALQRAQRPARVAAAGGDRGDPGHAGPGSGSPQLVVEIRQLGGAIAAARWTAERVPQPRRRVLAVHRRARRAAAARRREGARRGDDGGPGAVAHGRDLPNFAPGSGAGGSDGCTTRPPCSGWRRSPETRPGRGPAGGARPGGGLGRGPSGTGP